MAAQARTVLLCLAAFCLPAFANIPRASRVAEKPHQGVADFALGLHRGVGAANALIAPGIARCLCDEGRRSRSTGKERDAETGLDYFGARYMASAQGRFTSPDAPFADQRPGDPQSWNLYGYVRNNPLRFVDPTGRTLTASQGWADMQGDLCSILGAPDCTDRVSRDQKTGVVSIDFGGIDLSKNEGAQLLSDLVSSGNTYDLSYGATLPTGGRVINVSFLENLDAKPDWRYGNGKSPEDKPRSGVDGQVAFNWANITIKPFPNDPQSVPGSGPAPALRWTTVFHELAESYAKVDKGMPYMDRANPTTVGAHWSAIDRERVMRSQRPYLRLFQFGSGGGNNWVQTTKLKR